MLIPTNDQLERAINLVQRLKELFSANPEIVIKPCSVEEQVLTILQQDFPTPFKPVNTPRHNPGSLVSYKPVTQFADRKMGEVICDLDKLYELLLFLC